MKFTLLYRYHPEDMWTSRDFETYEGLTAEAGYRVAHGATCKASDETIELVEIERL